MRVQIRRSWGKFYRLHSPICEHLQELCREQRIPIVNQIPFAIHNPVIPSREIPGNLLHPQPVRCRPHPDHLHLPCGCSITNSTTNRWRPCRVHTSTVKNRQPRSTPSGASETLSTSFSASAPAQAQCHSSAECSLPCLDRFDGRDSKVLPRCAGTPNPDSPSPSPPRALRFFTASSAVLVRVASCRRIFGR